MVRTRGEDGKGDEAWKQVLERFARVSNLAQTSQRRTSRGAKWLRGPLVLGGGLLAAGAGAFTPPFWPMDKSEILVLVGAVMAFVAGVHDIVFTPTASDETAEASSAAAALLNAQREIEKHEGNGFEAYLTKVRLRELLQAVLSARSIVEDLITTESLPDVRDAMGTMLRASQAQLRAAVAFPAGHHWTLCIYQLQDDDGDQILRCIADDRYIPCSLADARTFKIGESVPGQAVMKAEAVTVHDLFSEASESSSAVPAARRKPNDDQRYRSITAYPILVGPDDTPWGVVVSSCALPGFFSARPTEELNPGEVVKVVSEMAATIAAAYVTVKHA